MIKIPREHKIYNMSKENPPVAVVDSGSKLEFSVYDAFQNQITTEEQSINELNWDTLNPATGPVYVNEAKPGDILKVTIDIIDVDPQGVMAVIPNAGLLGDEVTKAQIKIIPIEDGYAKFNDNIKIPINPMIGVIGVAPAGDPIPTGTPDSHGGNMDNKLIIAGTTLYFPVFVEGALLSMGDLHAVMGDGEIIVTGVEVSGKIVVTVEVIKGHTISNPIHETDSHFYTLGSALDLLDAVKIATKDMHNIVMAQLDMDFNEAGMLLSLVGDTEIAQVVDPLLTARFGVSKDYLENIF
jgi:amidase